MLKRFLSVIMAAVSLFSIQAMAQQPNPELPLNPNVKHGTLPNGLKYYILHNEEPKGRANFYIAQKVGSTLETPQQLGLAHFLEHMAFNGSKHFPGKLMLNYLQSKGIRFGADINAYTSFDETVYNINNIPTNDGALMDSVLLALHDWSCDLELLDAEIDAERGVIQEEWRSRNSAQIRMYTELLPVIFKEYQYTRMPIGTMDVVMNFPYQDLRDYYERWYRPDQQGIVIVGDFDAAEMEKKVIDMFTPIEMPADAPERVYPHVSDNKELIYAPFEDPEMQYMLGQLMFKYDKTPFEQRNTLNDYLQTTVANNIFASMVNTRFSDMSQKADCPFAMATISFGDLMVAKTKGSLTLTVIAKTDMKEAMQAAFSELVRSCKTGFTDSELTRAKDDMLSGYEKLYNERNKTNTETLARELIRHFVDNEPSPGIETEYTLLQQVLPVLPVQAFNEMARELLSAENQVLLVAQPKREGLSLPSEAEMKSLIDNAMNAEYEAYVDEVITEPLIAKLPKAGKVTKTNELPLFGATEYTLSNGAKVIVKPTDFAEDQIMVTAVRKGGKALYNGEYGADLAMIDEAVEASKVGPFDNVKLRKYLAGKNVSTNFNMGLYSDALKGSSGKKDLESLMQLIYATFTNMQPDQETYNGVKAQYETVMANADKNPQKIFQDSVAKTCYGNNPYANMTNLATVQAANYDNMFKIAKNTLANAADYTFVIIGNVDNNTLLPLVNQYIASLPSNPKKTTKPSDYRVRMAKGQVVNEFEQIVEAPVVNIFDALSGSNLEYNPANAIMLKLTSDILTNVFTETLREEEGGTYSPFAASQFNANTGEWTILYTFPTGADKKENINKRAYDETIKLLSNGTDAEHFQKVKEAMVNQYSINLKNNGFWNGQLVNHVLGTSNFEGYQEALNNVTLDQLNAFMKNLYNGQNRIQIIMDGVAKAN